MLVFGGLVRRDRTFQNPETGRELDIYNYCEDYERITQSESLPYYLRTCGEELTRDIWLYNVKDNFWTWIKPDYNAELYLYVKQPAARYGMIGTYVRLWDRDYYMSDGKTFLTRKYLYIYGGFSYDCETACLDLWRYEIPYGPQAMFPTKIGKFHNRGNHWTLVNEDPNYSPGPRIKSSIAAIQTFPDPATNVTKDEHYLYIFGGIKVRNQDDIYLELRLYPELADTEISSFEYMGDLWRFNLESSQWEEMEVFGISSIRREIYLWNNT